MPKVTDVWLKPAAEADIDGLYDFFSLHSQAIAARFEAAIRLVFARLSRFPSSGSLLQTRNKRLKKIRAVPVPKFRMYVLFYRELPDGVEVIRVLHGARDAWKLIEDQLWN